MNPVRTCLAAGLTALMLVVGFAVLRADIPQGDPVSINPGGEGEMAVRLATTLDDVAGVQGIVRYEPSMVSFAGLEMGATQPGSFAVRWFETEPGTVRFILYSIDDTLDKSAPVLVCRLSAPGGAGGDASAVVLELTYVATPDGEIHWDFDKYTNYPVRVRGAMPVVSSWFLY